ncbi:uncharacterized protein E0L32_002801 [Thyridium curvatum]|uniref:Zn(2)-C6 fungal-type domain-containing protein n=1 Tax=Thyridium curvatum TaxID=1093900 RepID=A0A507BLW2_9PEZI|nr:uncharacterized protein E0L32_002801 [Thyridium curvatum]TPX17700.1 hypothetical protein E0L32_002801 [Thyridium curvatum]
MELDIGLDSTPQNASDHFPRPSPRGTASYPRRRAVKACQTCRARRTKCDNRKPSCSFCLKVGATCIQSPVDLSSFDPASLKILERLDDLEEVFKSALSLQGSASGCNADSVPSPEMRVTKAPDQPLDPSVVMPVSTRQILSWPKFRCIAPQSLEFSSPESSHHQQSRPGPSAQSPISVVGTVDLEPGRAQNLVENFLNYVHIKNPIFDERILWRLVQSVALNGVDWSADSCLFLLVCALGSIATPFGPSPDTMPSCEAYHRAQGFFQAAQKRLGMVLCSDDILAPQCLFLSGVFMMCTFQIPKAWRFFLQALAHCQDMEFLSFRSQPGTGTGLEMVPQTLDSDTLHQAVYWSAWKSEREAQNVLSLPDFSRKDHGSGLYPAFFPTPPAASSEADLAGSGRQREQTAWYFYLAEISLRRLVARISDEIRTLQRTHSSLDSFLHAAAAAVPTYEAQIQEWMNSLPPSLSLDNTSGTDICQFVLEGHAINAFESIYWPFLAARLVTPVLDLHLLDHFLGYAQQALDNHAWRLRANEPGFRHRHHGTYFMIGSCSRSALVLVLTAWHIESLSAGKPAVPPPLVMPAGWRDLVTSVSGMLDHWSGETHDFDDVRSVLSQYAIFN